MTTFDKREQAFEAEFVHDEEIRFKAVARSNRLLGNWAAAKLGLTGDAALADANGLVMAELEHKSDEDTLHKVLKDLAPKGVSQNEVSYKMQECLRAALEQIKVGG
jgi:hypothetical protein